MQGDLFFRNKNLVRDVQKQEVFILFPRKPVDPVMSTLLFLKYSVILPSSNEPTILL
jgi:hypothetical protein